MTSSVPTHPSYDLSFLGHLFTAASQLQQKETGPEKARQQTPVADQQRSSLSSPSSSDHKEESSRPHQIHQVSPASVSVSSSLTSPSGSSPVSPMAPPGRASVSHIPVHLSENDQCIRLRFNLKGIKNSDISVGVQRGILMVQGTRFVRYEDEEDGATASLDTDSHGSSSSVLQRHRFCRRFAIDTDAVDIKKIQANLSSDGILTVVGPKKSSPCTVHVNVTEEEHKEGKQEEEPKEESTKPEGAQHDSIVSFLLDQAKARDKNGMGGSVSLSSFSGSQSSGSHYASEDDETMEDNTKTSSKTMSSR